MVKKGAITGIPRWRAFANSFRFVSNPLQVLRENLLQHGPTFYTYIGGIRKAIVSTDPAFLQHVLQKNHRNYVKSPIHFEKLGHFLGNGLLTSDGEYWLRQRRLIQPGFHRDRLAELVGIMQEVIGESMMAIDRKMEQHGEVDAYQEMLEVAFRIVARSLFSANLPEEDLSRLSEAVTSLQGFIIRQIRQPYLEPWFRVSGQLHHYEKIAAETDRIILEVIRRRRESGEERPDLLQMLLDARYEDTGQGMNDRQLLDESKILFVAGHETSANALAWTWYLLAQHPEALATLRAELTEKLGDRAPSFADLRQLEYTTQVIEESMRLYPPAWITDRMAVADDQLEELFIKKGDLVVAYIYGAHHSPLYWEEPEQFRPARFSRENRKNIPPYAYLPFGGGPRLCIGNNFAIMEMQLCLAAMVRRYDFELVEGQHIQPRALVTLRPVPGVRMRFNRRQ